MASSLATASTSIDGVTAPDDCTAIGGSAGGVVVGNAIDTDGGSAGGVEGVAVAGVVSIVAMTAGSGGDTKGAVSFTNEVTGVGLPFGSEKQKEEKKKKRNASETKR